MGDPASPEGRTGRPLASQAEGDPPADGGSVGTAGAVSERLPVRALLTYGAPSFAGAAMVLPIAIHLPKFYADQVLVPLGALGLAIALARAFDAITDPLMGWISDRTRTRWGRRRPYLVPGALLCAASFVALFSPPEGMAPNQATLWFAATFILYFLFHTMYIIPYYALGPELTLDYHERSRLFGVREGFVALGSLAAALGPSFFTLALSNERKAFSMFSVVFGSVLVLTYAWLTLRVRERPDFVQRAPNPLVPGIRRALRNGPFRILLATYVVGSIPGAIPGTLMPFYTAYVIRPDDVPLWLGIYLFTYFFSGFLFLPAWVWAARRFGKRGTWLASFAMGITGGPALFFLGEGDAVLLTILLVWTGSAFGAALFLGPAIQADVIDYDELHTGKRREAQYAAFWSILPKFVVIPSASIPIAILGSLGYVPGAPSQNPAVVLAIRSIFALVPASFSVFAFFIARRLPITEPTHRAIRAGIDAHRRGETVLDPLSGEVLPPPRERGVPEEAAWFLDHFSHRELVRLLGGSAARLVAGVALWAGGFLVLCVTAAWFVHRSLAGTESSPGIATVVGVLVAGLTFSASLFHLLRLRPALWVARRGVPEVQLRAHIGQL